MPEFRVSILGTSKPRASTSLTSKFQKSTSLASSGNARLLNRVLLLVTSAPSGLPKIGEPIPATRAILRPARILEHSKLSSLLGRASFHTHVEGSPCPILDSPTNPILASPKWDWLPFAHFCAKPRLSSHRTTFERVGRCRDSRRLRLYAVTGIPATNHDNII